MKRVLILTAAAMFLSGSALAARQSTPPPPPPSQQAPPSEAKPASPASVVGKWTLNVEAGQSEPATLVVQLTDKKVTGTLTGPAGDVPIAGHYTDGTLKFAVTIQTQRGEFTFTFTGALKDADTMIGTMSFGQDPVNWRAVRVKDAR
jgi:hypothetical protein